MIGEPVLEVQSHDVVIAKVDDQVVVVVDGNITVNTQDFSHTHLERILEAIGMDFAAELSQDTDTDTVDPSVEPAGQPGNPNA